MGTTSFQPVSPTHSRLRTQIDLSTQMGKRTNKVRRGMYCCRKKGKKKKREKMKKGKNEKKGKMKTRENEKKMKQKGKKEKMKNKRKRGKKKEKKKEEKKMKKKEKKEKEKEKMRKKRKNMKKSRKKEKKRRNKGKSIKKEKKEKKKGKQKKNKVKTKCLGCFCTVLQCCLITWATHSHPFRATVHCGCQPGPTGVDPSRQGGGSTMRQPSGCCFAAALH